MLAENHYFAICFVSKYIGYTKYCLILECSGLETITQKLLYIGFADTKLRGSL